MRINSRPRVILILLILIGGMIYALLPRPSPVEIAVVTRGPLQVTLTSEGITRLREPFAITAPLSGWLRRLQLEPGDPVSAGAEAFVLEPSPAPPVDARTLAQAHATVAALSARIFQLEAERTARRIEQNYYTTEYERQASLHARNMTPQTALEAARLNRDRSIAATRSAESAIESARHELTNARAILDVHGGQMAPQATQLLNVRVPIDGVVISRERVHEGIIQAGTPVLSVGNLNDLEVQSDVLSMDAVQLRPGMRVLIERWGGGAPLDGQVRRIEPSGFTRVSALGVDEQRVPVWISITTPRKQWDTLGEGFRVDARFILQDEPDILQAPTQAIFRDGTAYAAYVIREGRAIKTAVQPGRRAGLNTEILGGLAAGDRVIVRPGSDLHDGARVRPF